MVFKGLAIGLLAYLLSACGPASPYVIDVPQPDQMKPGPGLFSKTYGHDGEIYIVDQGSGFDGQIFKIIPETPTADCDGNGVFELNNDLPCFVNALLGIDTNPPGGICRADLNGDNVTNGEDVSVFVQCAVLGGCP